jgi:hypothetical protein
MRAINLLGPAIQLSTSGSAVGGALLVRVTHVTDTGSQAVYVTNKNGTNTASIYLHASETVYIQKDQSDLISASDPSGYVTPVVFVY